MTQLRQSGGFSLIEIMLALGVVSTIALSFAQMTVNQQRETRYLSQKSETIELKNSIYQTMLVSANCNWQIVGKTIDATNVTSTVPSNTPVNLGLIYGGPNASANVLARAGSLLPATQTGLSVSAVKLASIYATGAANEYKGAFEVQLDPSTTTRPLRPIDSSIVFQTRASDPISAKTIISCGTASSLALQTSCFASGNSYHNLNCCQMDPTTGVVLCKVKNSSSAPWNNFGAQPNFPAGTSGSYSLSCFGEMPFINCCREDQTTGHVLCKVTDSSNVTWNPYNDTNNF